MVVKILIVDDSEATRKAMETVLKMHNFEVAGVALDGEESIRKFEELRPDLVLMDIAMPKMHGIGAIKRIMSIDPQARILVVTALYSPKKRQEAMDAGALGLIEKPFDVADLISTIGSILTLN